MAAELIEVSILGLFPSNTGVAVFLGNEEKTFSIHVDHGVGASIAMLLRGQKRERPLTHDLIDLIFKAFHIDVEQIVINDLRNDTYFARLTLKAENEVHKKITEIDARPSDCLAIALEEKKPIYVSRLVWDKVSDISAVLEEMKQKLRDSESDSDFIEDDD
ncbi:MAG: bifunctional nuclease domain-containing protein [Verrucomicrobiota bacterium]